LGARTVRSSLIGRHGFETLVECYANRALLLDADPYTGLSGRLRRYCREAEATACFCIHCCSASLLAADDDRYHCGLIGIRQDVTVTGVDALAEELRTRGADVLDGPEDRVYGQREVVVKDCNGLILCFGEDTSGRAA